MHVVATLNPPDPSSAYLSGALVMVVAAPIMALVSATIGAIAAAHTEQTKKLSMTENQKRPPLISKWTTGLSD
jgi:hypothetical protein